MSKKREQFNFSAFSIEKAENLDDFQLNQLIEIQRVCKLAGWSMEDYRIESDRDNSLFLIAKNKNVIIGFILIRLSDITETGNIIDNQYKEADLLNFGVTEEFQGQGIGNVLFKKAQAILYGLNVNLVWLEVRESNIEAIKFYKKRSFTSFQIRKNFYTQPTENAVLMKLEL
jgi:[ribosomal protein S18]-alanine N-acetyltransferase